MSSASWINLTHEWRLQDVQAALNVIITGLSALGIFACVRFCWQSGVSSAARHQSIPISTLLSVNTFGEAIDVFWLLKTRIFHLRHIKILIQAILVVLLSVTALVSGPIARYSTNLGRQTVTQEIPGLIAWRRHNSILNAPVIWNQTFANLDQAEFPYDRFLDYLPDPSVHWVYDPDEWNSSWALDCKNTELTPITLEDVGDCTSILHEIPGLQKVLSLDKYDLDSINSSTGSYYEDGIFKDSLLAINGAKVTLADESLDIVYEMAIDIVSVHLHNISLQENSSSECYYGRGPIESARYTKIECTATRLARDPDPQYLAFPDGNTPQLVARALIQNYQAQFVRESIRNANITVLTPRDLTRFLQVWTATKDTQDGFPVSRYISVQVPVVQLSTAFLAIIILTFVLIFIGISSYIFAWLRNRKTFEETPQSKLEWILKLIQVTDRDASSRSPPHKPNDFNMISPKRTRTSRLTDMASSVQENAKKRRSDFENAKYSNTVSIAAWSGAGASPHAQHVPASHEWAPKSWKLPPLPFNTIPRKPVSSAYTSISEIQSLRVSGEGETLVSKAS